MASGEPIAVAALGGDSLADAGAGLAPSPQDEFADMVGDEDLQLLGITMAEPQSASIKKELGNGTVAANSASAMGLSSEPLASAPELHGGSAPQRDGPASAALGDDDDDDAMFASLFAEDDAPEAPCVDGRGGRDEARAPLRRCSICGSTQSDIDLADPASSRMTPFVRMRADSTVPVCDHCEMMLRYQEGEKVVSTTSLLKSFSESAEAKAQYMHRLACYLALKQSQRQSKVHKVTLASTMEVMEAFVSIADSLSSRSSQAVTKPRFVIGLRSFVQKFGNPLNLSVELCQALVLDKCQIVAISNSPIETGRHSLESVVAEAAGSATSPAISSLKAMSVDSLDDARLVKLAA